MNQEHYQKVLKVLAQVRVAHRELFGQDGESLSPSAIASRMTQLNTIANQIWKSEFPSKSRLDLSGADFSNCIFVGAPANTLEEANLRNAKLDETLWCLAFNLKRADLTGASLRKAIIMGPCIDGASFRQADLSAAKMDILLGETADLTQANLSGVKLKLGCLRHLNVNGANLSGCRIGGGKFAKRDFEYYSQDREKFLARLSPEQRQQIIIEEMRAPKTACFVATAACGSPMAPEVQTLKDFRDAVLLRSLVGRALCALLQSSFPAAGQMD